MKTTILNSIKNGQPFSYKAGYPMNSKRVWTISVNKLGHFILSANDLKSKTVLNEAGVIEILNNQ